MISLSGSEETAVLLRGTGQKSGPCNLPSETSFEQDRALRDGYVTRWMVDDARLTDGTQSIS